MRGKMIKRILSVALSAVLVAASVPAAAAGAGKAAAGDMAREDSQRNLLKLWYDEPASGLKGSLGENDFWEQYTLPIGNSFMGANVYGEIVNERMTFNQKTLWNGGPSTRRPDYNGGNIEGKSTYYQQAVQKMLEGKTTEAESICGQLVGRGLNEGYGAYQSWGDIYLTFPGLTGQTSAYERNLDLTTGIANVNFTIGQTEYYREYFVSYPDNVLVMHLTAQGGEKLSFNVKFPLDNGQSGVSQESSVTGSNLGKDNISITVDSGEGTIRTKSRLQDNQMKMSSMVKVVTGGTIAEGSDNQSLDISGANEAVIYLSADTDYKNAYPSYRTGETDEELAESVKTTVTKAAGKGFAKVKEDYLADYQGLFGRLSLDLGQSGVGILKTTDALLTAYKNSSATDAEKRLLEVLLYQYGRYLTIASSRNGDLPANLQGVWQNRVGNGSYVPWGSDYHINVNLQMNYWPTYAANLVECAYPLIDYVDSLREPGRVTAKNYFGIESGSGQANGFTAHTQCTPFGWTCPGWSFDWGWSPAAVPWILQNCWEYYEYTGDLDYMKRKIYPMLKEQSLLYDQILVDSGVKIVLPNGKISTRLVSVPAYSPEQGPRTLGNVYENGLIWQLYDDTVTAAKKLGIDSDLVQQWEENRDRLAPIEIGDSGQIKEWFHETTLGSLGTDRQHRHMSHLLALYPGDLISVENKAYIDAAHVSLADRGYNSTGWGLAQRINAWARTGDGNGAYRAVESLVKNKIYANLWDTHPPFQIDGNFGYTSGINEMLMQSNMGYINVLPAIPDGWSKGSVSGLLTRGNFVLGMDWDAKKATKVTIRSNNGGACTVQCTDIKGNTVTVKDSKNQAVTVTKDEARERITFGTVKGETYTITGFGTEAKLAAPTGGTATASANSVSVSWSAVTGAASYNIYRKSGDDYVKIANVATGAAYADNAGLDENEDVPRYRIAAVRASGQEGLLSDVITANISSFTVEVSFGSDKQPTGTLPEKISRTGGASVTLPDCKAALAGYSFAGWSDGKTTYAVGASYTMPWKNITLKAVWKIGEYIQKGGKTYKKLAKAGWTATAGSQHGSGNDGPAGSAIDDNEGTWWHSNYNAGQFPTISESSTDNWFIIDFGKTVSIDQFEYVPRDVANANGTITGYKLFYSTGQTEANASSGWTSIGTGTWTNNTEKKSVDLSSRTSMRRIKICATATGGAGGTNKFISAAEFNVYQEFNDIVLPTDITVSPASMSLASGASQKIEAAITPENASYKDLTYMSYNPQVANVAQDGTVTAGKRGGTAQIKIKGYGGIEKTVTVTVAPPAAAQVQKISLDKDRVVLKPQEQAYLSVAIEPYYGTDKTVTWTSSDPAVATCTNGRITAVAKGTAVITAAAAGGAKMASCTVFVVETGAEKQPGDTAQLQAKVTSLANKNTAIYTAESVQRYQAMLAYAKQMLSSRDVSQVELNDALDKLVAADAGLTKIDPGAPDPENPDPERPDPENPDQPQSPQSPESPSEKPGQPNQPDQPGTQPGQPDKPGTPGTQSDQGSVLNVGSKFEEGDFAYLVTKDDEVSVTGLSQAGASKGTLVIGSTVDKSGKSFKITAIGSNAFIGNAAAKKVTIGANVKEIGAKAFANCKKLNSIALLSAAVPKIGKQAFLKLKAKSKIYYPKAMKKPQLKKLQAQLKKAGAKSVSYKAKK